MHSSRSCTLRSTWRQDGPAISVQLDKGKAARRSVHVRLGACRITLALPAAVVAIWALAGWAANHEQSTTVMQPLQDHETTPTAPSDPRAAGDVDAACEKASGTSWERAGAHRGPATAACEGWGASSRSGGESRAARRMTWASMATALSGVSAGQLETSRSSRPCARGKKPPVATASAHTLTPGPEPCISGRAHGWQCTPRLPGGCPGPGRT